MKAFTRILAVSLAIWGAARLVTGSETPPLTAVDQGHEQGAHALLTEGRQIFRFDTFGDEAFWGDQLRLHEAIAGERNGGVGPGLSPRMALALGLKIDSEALSPETAAALRAGAVNLDDPSVTIELLRQNAVVGVTGFVGAGQSGSKGQPMRLNSVGIQCALCHSTVDNSFAPGMGRRLDGWPNRDLNVGEIVALAPDLSPFVRHFALPDPAIRAILKSWGPGKFDAELILDGKAFRPDGKSAATLLPAAFGLAGVNLHTYTGWGSVTHWNAFVANLEMHGSGTFYDPRLNDPVKFPFAVKNGLADVRNTPDRITSKLPALHFYQLSLRAPRPPADSFDKAAAERGEGIFNGKAKCARCHVPPIFTEPGWNMHSAEEIGIDNFQALRSPDGRYRTTPLGGLFTRTKGGFYHDGRFADLPAVVDHYDGHFRLQLTPAEKADLVEYLKSL